ncbi:MAG: YbhB/YbcL family Raf kinase inhibitor-like protein [Dissulfurispiraceae bacterium]
MIIDDPDAPAGTWTHWVVWNIESHTHEIKEHSITKGASQGLTSFRKRNYGGPCPPSVSHRYHFTLYALDTMLTLDPYSTRVHVEKAMEGHIIAQRRIIGLYRENNLHPFAPIGTTVNSL